MASIRTFPAIAMHPLLTINEHRSSSYSGRTVFNIKAAHLTVAIAMNFETAGEILTRQHARANYIGIPLSEASHIAGKLLVGAMQQQRATTLNIAGNGIYTLADHGWTQDSINQHLADVLWPVRHIVEQIVCGGQTGVDHAGAVAGVALGIPVVVTMPKGFKRRDARGRDSDHSHHEIFDEIVRQAHEIREALLPTTPRPVGHLQEQPPPAAAALRP